MIIKRMMSAFKKVNNNGMTVLVKSQQFKIHKDQKQDINANAQI